jgi:stress response protein SCP2
MKVQNCVFHSTKKFLNNFAPLIIKKGNKMAITLTNIDKAAKQGIVLHLNKLKKVGIALEWGTPSNGARADLDLMIIKKQENDVREMDDITCYATGLKTAGVHILEDVTTGGGEPERAVIVFDDTPESVNEISLWAMVFTRHLDKKDHTFGNVADGRVTLTNQDTGEVIAQYELGTYGDSDTLRIGDFYFADGLWKFRPCAQSARFGTDAIAVVLSNLGFAVN